MTPWTPLNPPMTDGLVPGQEAFLKQSRIASKQLVCSQKTTHGIFSKCSCGACRQTPTPGLAAKPASPRVSLEEVVKILVDCPPVNGSACQPNTAFRHNLHTFLALDTT